MCGARVASSGSVLGGDLEGRGVAALLEREARGPGLALAEQHGAGLAEVPGQAPDAGGDVPEPADDGNLRRRSSAEGLPAGRQLVLVADLMPGALDVVRARAGAGRDRAPPS